MDIKLTNRNGREICFETTESGGLCIDLDENPKSTYEPIACIHISNDQADELTMFLQNYQQQKAVSDE